MNFSTIHFSIRLYLYCNLLLDMSYNFLKTFYSYSRSTAVIKIWFDK